MGKYEVDQKSPLDRIDVSFAHYLNRRKGRPRAIWRAEYRITPMTWTTSCVRK